ncbi:hypothetical protein MBOL_08390 [Mycobacteroides abscessus subsp. bolletii BD]|nr:hypothetical protein MBOL_08390 [Mycobacteroides abscessus subsp. bolletii BD]
MRRSIVLRRSGRQQIRERRERDRLARYGTRCRRACYGEVLPNRPRINARANTQTTHCGDRNSPNTYVHNNTPHGQPDRLRQGQTTTYPRRGQHERGAAASAVGAGSDRLIRQCQHLVIGEKPGADQKPHALGRLQRKS